MSGTNPESVLYDINGNPLAVQSGSATPTSTPALMMAGSDGANSRFILVDGSGRTVAVGAGVAGTPAGGVLSIQGISGGTVVPISGTLTANQGTANTIANSWPIEVTDGTNILGTAAHPIRIDPTGTTIQPVSGTVAVTQSTSPWVVGQATASSLNATVVGLGGAGAPSGGIISTQVPDTINSGTLNALNAVVSVSLTGNHGAGMQLLAGTLQGTITPEISYDGGTTWVASFFDDPVTGNKVATIVFGANNTATARTIVAPAGASHARVRVSAFTSGTANCNIRATTLIEPPVLFSGAAGAALPPTIVQMGGNDGSNLRAMLTDASGHPIIVGPGVAGTPSGGVVTIQGVSGGTVVPVSGTVAVTQSTSPWADNITQFGGTNISTGTGASGAGIPRVTVSNDSNILATQSGSWTVTDNQGTPNTLANKWPVQVTDGTNTMPTGDAVGRAIFEKITDGTNTAAVKAASTAAVATDPSLVVGFSPNSPLPTGANTIGIVNQGTAASLANAWSTKITDATNGPVAVKAASTAAVATDPALVVAISPNNVINAAVSDVTATGTLNALNATVQLAIQGENDAGMQLVAGTLVGTIVPEISIDGGTTWAATFFSDPTTKNKVSSIVFGSSNTATTRAIVGVGGTSHVRVRVSAFTSGTATCNLRATAMQDPSNMYDSSAGAALPPTIAQVGGSVTTASPTYVTGTANALSLDTSGRLREDVTSWLGSTAPTVGQKTMANSVPVTIASDQSAIPVSISAPAGARVGLVQGIVILGGGTGGSLNAIRATTYNEQTTNAQRSVSSASASDTSAGTGARQITITYYDQTCAGPFTEVVTMNGTTSVNTVSTTICFIEKIQVTSVGSGGTNAGVITLFVSTAGGGGTIGTIGTGNVVSGVGDRQTLWAHHYIATGKTAQLATLVIGSTNSSASNATFLMRSKDPTSATSSDLQISDFLPSNISTVRALGIPLKIAGPARILVLGNPTGNNSTLVASFDYSET
jgi:hypothetical protein